MRVSVIAPVLNESPWIGYSIMSCLDQIHEFIYSLDDGTSDGTRELLQHIKDKYAHEKLTILPFRHFHPHDTKAYNEAFNVCIEKATGDACWFFHPDMLVTNPESILSIPEGPLAWWTEVTSYAGDFNTVISKGRATKWKNIHARKFGLTYVGGYGSLIEDMYFSEITSKTYKHFGEEFYKYPYAVGDSGVKVNHYCELKSYSRRLEKMKLCIKTQVPNIDPKQAEALAIQHPRVTLEPSSQLFGKFQFEESKQPIPSVVEKYKDEFSAFIKEPACV